MLERRWIIPQGETHETSCISLLTRLETTEVARFGRLQSSLAVKQRYSNRRLQVQILSLIAKRKDHLCVC